MTYLLIFDAAIESIHGTKAHSQDAFEFSSTYQLALNANHQEKIQGLGELQDRTLSVEKQRRAKSSEYADEERALAQIRHR